jgi:serine/threonine protein kinase
VYQAFNSQTGQMVAVKRFPLAAIGNEQLDLSVEVCPSHASPNVNLSLNRTFPHTHNPSHPPPPLHTHTLPRHPFTYIPPPPTHTQLAEIELMHELDHPNIVKYYDTVQTKSFLYIVLE